MLRSAPSSAASSGSPTLVPLQCSNCEWTQAVLPESVDFGFACPQCDASVLRLQSESVFAPVKKPVRPFIWVAIAVVGSATAFVAFSPLVAIACSVVFALVLLAAALRQRSLTRVIEKAQWIPLLDVTAVPDGFHISKPLVASYEPPSIDPFHEEKIARAKARASEAMHVPEASGAMRLVHEDFVRSPLPAADVPATSNNAVTPPHPVSLSTILLPHPTARPAMATPNAVHNRQEWGAFAATSV